MEKYTLTHCVNYPATHTKTSWTDFEKMMRNSGVREAIIFLIDDVFTEVSLGKRAIIGASILKKDNVDFLDSYCLVLHEENDLILPCIIWLDPDIRYAVLKVMEFRENTSFIQCVITDENQFIVHECQFEQADSRLNLTVN